MARLKDKVQNALDEARLLILGTQVLLGLQYRAVFERGFERLSTRSQYVNLAALSLLLIALALLILPGAYHRVVVSGEDTEGVHHFTTRVTELALAPFGVGLSLNVFVAGEKLAGSQAGLFLGLAMGVIAFTFWYGIEAIQRNKHHPERRGEQQSGAKSGDPGGTKLRDKIEHVLTETKVVLPGAQALLGFQFITMLTDAFDNLPASSKYAHFVSLCMIAVTIVLLMTPAAYHRIVEKGEETEHFHTFASRMMLAAMVPLALGVCGDFYVVTRKVTDATGFSLTAAGIALALFYGFWFGLTFYLRRERRRPRLPGKLQRGALNAVKQG